MQGQSLTVHDKISTLRFARVVFNRETLHKERHDKYLCEAEGGDFVVNRQALTLHTRTA
jgi:hypothetical protein